MNMRQSADPHEIEPVDAPSDTDSMPDTGLADIEAMFDLSFAIIFSGIALGSGVAGARKLVEGIKETGVSAVFGEIDVSGSVIVALAFGGLSAYCTLRAVKHGRRWRG